VGQAKLPAKDSFLRLKCELLGVGDEDETRYLIGEGAKVKSEVRQVKFKPDPTPLMSVTIVCFQPGR
jgi:hypothetical protein